MYNKDYILELIQTALNDLDQQNIRLSAVARKALRIARLRNDWKTVYWLQIELDGFSDKNAVARREDEVAPYFSKEVFDQVKEQAVEDAISSRTIIVVDHQGRVDEDKVCALGIQEIEESIISLSKPDLPLPDNMLPYDAAYFSDQQQRSRFTRQKLETEYRKVLARITQRVCSYLSQVERQIVLGQLESDIFDDNRRYVDERLQSLAPEILGQLHIAYRRTREGTSEARSHALTSCRRVLKALADLFYPPSTAPVMGVDGKERVLNDSMYIARLWQFISDLNAGSKAKQILHDDVISLGERIDRLYQLTNKGVHETVTEFEVNMCVLSTYNVIGAIFRLIDESPNAITTVNEQNGF